MACCALLIGLSFSSFLPFRGCFGQVLFSQFSIVDSKTVQRSALCRFRRELSVSPHVPFLNLLFEQIANSNEYLPAKFSFDTAENEACKVCPLFEYRSPGEEPSLPSLPSLPEGAALPEGAELGIAGFLILAGVISLFVGGPLWESTGMSAEDSMKAADSAPAFGFEPKRPDSPPSFGFAP